jgi:glutathione S-transferase
MTALTFHYHPLASFCWKGLIALYENATPFTPQIIDLGNAESRDRFAALWPVAKMPVLEDSARGHSVPESTVIIEYLDRHYPGATRFIPEDGEAAWQTRLWDRIYDHYLHEPMQKIVLNRIRPADGKDPMGVADARRLIGTAYGMVERVMAQRVWAMGDHFSLVDCAAAPALYYANLVSPFGDSLPATCAYLDRLMQRPSFARVLAEAQPYFQFFPQEPGEKA